jgi:hypothetical protein
MTGRQSLDPERGAGSTLSMVLLTPLFFVISMLAFNGAMWAHARTEARVRVRDLAGQIARSGFTAAQAEMEMRARISEESLLREIQIDIVDLGSQVTVSLRGRAPGLVRGTSAPVDVSATLWRERWQP